MHTMEKYIQENGKHMQCKAVALDAAQLFSNR